MLKKTLIANYIGQGWSALMGFAFLPAYIHYLGIESYALVGFFAILQAWLSLLDMGMSTALNREFARFTGGDGSCETIRDLLRSVEIVVLALAFLIIIGVASSSSWMATYWVASKNLSIDVVVQFFMVAGLVIALRFIEGVYRSALVGLQQQVLYNVIASVMATVRGLGAVAVLRWVSPSLNAFIFWQAVVSIITVAILVPLVYCKIPKSVRSGRFSFHALGKIRDFAGGVLGMTVLSMLLTQVDKIMLSKLLSLSEFGYYILASTTAGVTSVLLGPITQAFFPRLCELHARGDRVKLAETFHHGAQLVTIMIGSSAIVLIMLSETFLRLWTHDEQLATLVAPLLALLVLGNLLNSLMWIPIQIQLAFGWTSLIIRANILLVIVIVPAILLVTPRFGAIGAAWIWVILNASYVIFGMHFICRRLLKEEKWGWYFQDVLFPIGACLAGVVTTLMFFDPAERGLIAELAKLILAASAGFIAAILAAGRIRKLLHHQFTNWFVK